MSYKASTPPSVKDTAAAAKPADVTTDTTSDQDSTWGNIASSLWDSLKELSSVKPVGTGKDAGSTDNPGGGAGSGTLPEGSMTKPPQTGSGSGIKLGDGVPPGKGEGEGRGFTHVGDKTIKDGDGGKVPREDGDDIEPTGGKTVKEGDNGKTPREDDGRGMESAGGKTVEEGDNDCVPREEDLDGRSQPVGDGKLADAGASPKPDLPEIDPRGERTPPGQGPTDQMPKPTLPEIGAQGEKTARDGGKGQNTDQGMKKIPIPAPGLPGAQRTSKYGPHPKAAPDEAPSAEDQEAASEILNGEEVSSALGLDALAQDAADAIISGNLVDQSGVEPDPENPSLESILKNLESQGAEGAEQLTEMAKQLGNLLGTRVTPDTDGEFGLDIMTQYSDSRNGCFPSGTSETSLHVGSDGEVTASGSRYWDPNFPNSVTADAGKEAARLQALATRSVLELPQFLNDMNDIDFSADPDRRNN